MNFYQVGYRDPNSSNNDWADKEFLKYHQSQWNKSKYSTGEFIEFISNELSASKNILDLGCGAGAAVAQISRNYPDCNFIGIDHSVELIEIARKQVRVKEINNLQFYEGNILNLRDLQFEADGVICIQTISWLNDFRELFSEIIRGVQPKWIAISGLFYEGNITAKIEILEHERQTKTFFNVYSLPEISRFINPLGYKIQSYQPFELKIDLPKPENINVMQTYTEHIVSDGEHRRIQISGPLLINSGFLKLIPITEI